MGNTSTSTSTSTSSMVPRCILLALLTLAVAADDDVRKPKLFFVSTSATTSTLQTASVCYISSKTALGTCAGRKRRTISLDGVDMEGKLQPSQANQEVMAADVCLRDVCLRDGRFLLYWIPTTSISTSTS